jgi:hypothetical protein
MPRSMTILIAVLIIAALIVAIVAVNGIMRRSVTRRHDSLEDAMSDENEPVPSAHLIPDNETAAGDTPEAHDEINPHDLPPDHPGRHAAEEQAEAAQGEDDVPTTRGDDDLAQASPRRDERLNPPADDER